MSENYGVPKKISDDNKYFFLNRYMPNLTNQDKQNILKDAVNPQNHYLDLSGFINELFNKCLENGKIHSAELCQKTLVYSNALGTLRNYDTLQDYFYKKKDLVACEQACLKALSILPDAIWYTQKDISVAIKYLGAIKRLCIIYKNKKEFDKVLSLARLAIKMNLSDGTKGGFFAILNSAMTKTDELYDITKELGYDINHIEDKVKEYNGDFKKE